MRPIDASFHESDDVTFALAREVGAASTGVLSARAARARFEAMFPVGAGVSRYAALLRVSGALGVGLHEPWPVHRARVLDALNDGRVVALRRQTRSAHGAAASPREEPVVTATHDAAPTETLTWITIRLVDDFDPPRPVGGARYRIKLPDGSTREGRLDRSGTAHLADIDPGTCEVSFPEYDGASWSRAS